MTDEHAEFAEYVRRLLARDEAAEPDPTPTGNHSPREGTNPPASGGDDSMREFTRRLFNPAD